MSGPPKITLDTNCIINLFDHRSTTRTSVDLLEELIRQALSNKIEIAVTTRVEADLANDKNDDRRGEMLSRLNLLPIVGTVLRWDVSKWDKGDFFANDEAEGLEKEIQRIVFPGLTAKDRRYTNKINDIDHLVGHKMNGRDVFVTDDSDVLKKHSELRASLGITVMSPGECTAYLEQLESRRRATAIPHKKLPKQHHSPAFSGSVTFDYRNFDGRFFIGDGQQLFETVWSKASTDSIHAYSDGATIDSIAIARGAVSFEEVRDLSEYDFSSRVRSPELGQIVVWKNKNGDVALTKIVSIKDDTRGDKKDELTFDYVIRTTERTP